MNSNIKFDEINRLAALRATKALSKLLDMPINLEIPTTVMRKLEQIHFFINPEELSAGVYLPINGDAEGASLLIFPEKTVFCLCDLLLKRKPGINKELTELDRSALREVGNIVIGNYLTIFSNKLKVKLIESLPEFRFTNFGSLIEQIKKDYGAGGMEVLVIELNFVFKPTTLKGHALVFFAMDQIKKIIEEIE